MSREISLGATYLGEGRCSFCVWAPLVQSVAVKIISPRKRLIALERHKGGYHHITVEGIEPGSFYLYRLDDHKERPDPASRFQPQGVHGPSQVVDPHFIWDDDCWSGLPLCEYLIYELHVGTFTPVGTFEAIIPHLNELRDLGITAIELMPVAQFPGTRNWGYDGTYPFAVQNSYGGPEGLKRLVNNCHQAGLAVVLDVVYNHLGTEGNYLADFGPYFTDRYRGPWGSPINFDGPYSDEVRRFFIENALFWIKEFRVDGLRIDAVHGIFDFSTQPFLAELALAVHTYSERLNRRVYLIPESDLNDTRLIRSRELGGLGLDAQWNDDFHHALHALLTGEDTGYYQDFGKLEHLVKSFREGFVCTGDYSSYRRRHHGESSRSIPAERFVVFSQNHDQVGNRGESARLSDLVSFEALKLAAGVVLLSPFIPLLFMGEEYGETSPFSYFTSHSDSELIEAVRRGRRQEFASFRWLDPQEEATFLRSKLNQHLRSQGHHQVMLSFYQELVRLRKNLPQLSNLSKEDMEVIGLEQEKILILHRWSGLHQAVTVFHFDRERRSILLPLPPGRWLKRLASADPAWNGPGCSVPAVLVSEGEFCFSLLPESFVVLLKQQEGLD